MFHISLDGLAGTHDLTRHKAGGQGTFERIWSNLLALHESDLNYHVFLRVHATPENHAALPALVEKLNHSLEDDTRFHVYFKRIGKLGGPNDGRMRVLDRHAEGDIAATLRAQLRPSLREPLREEAYVCYAASPNSLAIRADGRIAKCTVALRDERNHLGRISSDGSVSIDQDKLRMWMRGFATQDVGELACPMHGMGEA
jgi:uncharacterized protein